MICPICGSEAVHDTRPISKSYETPVRFARCADCDAELVRDGETHYATTEVILAGLLALETQKSRRVDA